MHKLSDDEIDSLLLLLFHGGSQVRTPDQAIRIEDLSQDELLRIRSRNHPDKWPNVNQTAYQAAVEELDRRRRLTKKP